MERVDYLDKGYVQLKETMGSDLHVVNAARASFEKESDEFDERDSKLLNFLIREGHTSVLRHCFVSFEIRSPLMVARQHFKYQIASNFNEYSTAWNESSRRYISDRTEFYIPNDIEWRSKPENAKQGSGDPVDYRTGRKWTQRMQELCEQSERWFQEMQDDGICAEQARLVLPAYGLYIRYYWSCSLQAVLHFLAQRLEHDAQKEIQNLAVAVQDLVRPYYPRTFEAFDEYRSVFS